MAVSKVFMICNAYESGIGHGYKSTGVINPHRGNTDEYEAFEIGYVKGIKNRNGGDFKMINKRENNILTLDDTLEDIVVKMSKGNPGAMSAIVSLLSEYPLADPLNPLKELAPILTFDYLGIYGTDLYIIWNDKCNRDVYKIFILIRSIQLGFMDGKKLVALSKDQLNKLRLSSEDWASLGEKVCSELKGN